MTESVAYIVKAWPRLSETFILNEILDLERQGVAIRIFSVRDPDPGPVHARVALVRAKVSCLSLATRWKSALPANFRSLFRQPRSYLHNLISAIVLVLRHRRSAALRHFFRAGYLADLLSREPCPHLHAHFASTPALVALLASRLTGIPYTLTAHAKDIYANDPDRLRPKLREARAVITCTEYNRQHLLRQYRLECDGKLHCIYHGVNLSQFPFSWPHTSDNGDPLVLSVARLVEKKGLEDLISAAAVLRRRGRRFKVEIIGDGPMESTLQAQLTDLGLGGFVELLGAQPQETVCLAYRRASVFALPCKIAGNGDRDGIPNVLLEAVASGVPVVSTPVSGIPELIESGREGLLVEPNQPAMLADALEEILSSPELSGRLARAARVKLEARFSLDRSSARLRALFEKRTSLNVSPPRLFSC
ncbi:MAG TPA: glycosyltransferase family 4 protein [Gemmatimonadales bacterium]|nr:glycosyltransferase family 4 protein [Gemmatimonadales bacterium]